VIITPAPTPAHANNTNTFETPLVPIGTRRLPLGSPDLGILESSPRLVASAGFQSAAGFATAGGMQLNEPGAESVERIARIFQDSPVKPGVFKKPLAFKTPAAYGGKRQVLTDFKLSSTPSVFMNAGKLHKTPSAFTNQSFTDFKLPNTPSGFDIVNEGFSTAGGSALNAPSEASMRRASNMFADDDFIPPPPDSPVRLDDKRLVGKAKTKRRSTQFVSPLGKPGRGVKKGVVVNRRQSLLSSKVVRKVAMDGALISLILLVGEKMVRKIERPLEKHRLEFQEDVCGNVQSPLNLSSSLRFVFTDGNVDSAASLFSSKGVSRAWVENHYAQIVYKLASVAYSIPSLANCFTFTRVMKQLDSRFEREVSGSTRSAVRKIVERDAAAGRYLVLYVVSIGLDNKRIVVSDGWYCISACVDSVMERAIEKKIIVVGTKIAVCNAVVLIVVHCGIGLWKY
jgi:hypothetical protein